MADTPKLDLAITSVPKTDLKINKTSKIELTNPYTTVSPLYELISNKITDLNTPEISDDAYPTVNAITAYIHDNTDYLSQISGSAIQLANENALRIGDQEHGLDAKESSANKVQNITENLDPKKYPSTVAVFEFGMLIDNGCKSYVSGYTNQKIGDIETALDSIIALQNQYTGGDGI